MISNSSIPVNNVYGSGPITPSKANQEFALSQVQQLLSEQYESVVEILNNLDYLESRLELVLSYTGGDSFDSSKGECDVKSVPEPPLVETLKSHNGLLFAGNKRIQGLISRLAI